MKFKNIIIATLVMACSKASAQSFAINSNGAAAHNSAILDITSTAKGMLVPRLSAAQRTAIAAPAKGLLVYDSTVNQFAYYDGTAWLMLNAGGSSWTVSGSNQYSNVTGNVGIGVTAPASKLHVIGNAIIGSVTNTNTGANSLVAGNGNTVTATHALVSGNANTAAGNYSVVLNNSNTTTAAATTSIAGGFHSYVNANLGLAIGNSDTTNAIGGAAFGFNNNADGAYALVSGSNNNIIGTNSFSTGNDNSVTGTSSFATGSTNIVSGSNSVSSGYHNIIAGNNSIVSGNNNNVAASYAWVSGNDHTASGNYSVVLNNTNTTTATATTSIAGGFQSYVNSNIGLAIGFNDSTYGQAAAALGFNNKAYGANAFVTGAGNTAASFSETALGLYGTTYTPGSTNAFVGTDRLLNIGNGTNTLSRADAFTILKNGNVGIGKNVPTQKLDVNGTTATTHFQMTNGATNGYVLQSDAAGNGTWVNPVALPITETDPQVSSANNNYIPRWNGSTLADGAIYDDSTNVGIGLVPSKRFQVHTGVAATAAVSVSQTSGGGFVTGNVPQWQSFTAVTAGVTDKVTLRFWATPAVTNRTVSIYKGQGTSGALLYTGSPVAVPIAAAGVDVDFPIPGITLVAGQQYTIAIDNGARWLMSASDPYANGISSFNNANDYRFELYLFANNPGFSVSNAGVSINDYTLPFADGAANQVLQTNGAGVTAWVNSTALAVTETDPQVSSATIGYLPKWNGTSLVDGLLYDNGIGIGLGVTNPIEKFHVKGSALIESGRLAFRNTGGGVFVGENAGLNDFMNTNFSTFIGHNAGQSNTAGNNNVAVGARALFAAVSGNYSTAIGKGALENNTGTVNTALGAEAGQNATGSFNVFIGPTVGMNETGNNKLYIDNSNTSSPLIYGDFGTNVLTVNGNLGVGTTNPTQAKLVVNGSQAQTFASYGYLNRTHPTGTINGNTSSSDYSIYATDRIAAPEFNAFSDARIKNIKGPTNNAEDLQTLMGIKITNYTLRDSIGKGNKPFKKVIAQQVEQVYPQAVGKMIDVVPDIYRQAEMKSGVINLATSLKVGDKVKLIFESGAEMAVVTAATATSFTVDKKQTGNVFVFGREVNDFRSVDYEAISMLNVSATQELAKQLQQQKELVAQQQQQIEQLINELKKLRQPLPVSSGGAL